MDPSISAKDEIWFLRVCHHVSNALYHGMKVYSGSVGEVRALSLQDMEVNGQLLRHDSHEMKSVSQSRI